MKKLLSLVSLIAVFVNSIGLNAVFSNFEQSTFMIKGLSVSPYVLNPGDLFHFDIISSNTLLEPIKEAFLKIDFQNNTNFSYSETAGKGQLTRINGSNVGSCITSTYSSTGGLNCEITNPSNLTIPSGIPFSTASKAFEGFKVELTAKNYQNNLTSWVEAKKTSDSTPITGTFNSKIIYVNVKPHITSYAFSKSSIVGNGIDSVDLTLAVKDYNGCTNINGGVITANLTVLGLTNNEVLVYNSCNADGKTALFKKVGITTLTGTGDKTLYYTGFTATDMDGNSTDPTDPNTTFGNEDLKTNIILTVATPVAPVVTIASTTPPIIGSAGTSTVAFSADKVGTYKVVLNGNGSCSSGTIVTDWTAYTATGSVINSVITGVSLTEGANAVYTCVKSNVGDIGSANTTITKDTVPPVISSVTVSPASVITTDSSTSFQCNEVGSYQVTMNAFNSGYMATTANTTNTVALPFANMAVGVNTVTLYCQDTAGNIINTTSSVSRVAPTPAMTASGMTLVDNDVEWDGVDGRDLKVTWDSTVGTTYTGFESYRIYVLPSGTTFTGSYLGLVANSGATTWTGTSNILNDSLGNPLSSGNYVTYVAIMGTSGQIGTPANATGALVADVVPHPSVLSASFTSTGMLSVKFNAALKEGTGSHYATGFVYQVGPTTYTGVSISSVVNDTINIAIPDVGSTSATGILAVGTGAAWGVPVAGSYNYGTGGVVIADVISPNVTNFATGTTSYYTNFYSGSLVFNYTVSENLIGAGNTKIVFTRVGGNADTSKTAYITLPANLTVGSHSEMINLSTLGLVSGAYYNATLVAQDLVGNTITSSPITVKFDKTGPSIVSLNPFGPQSVLGIGNPTFAWFASTDDGGNGSGVKGYKLRVYTGSTTYASWNTCTGTYAEYNITTLAQLTQQVTLSNLYNYAWGVFAYDNMENIGTLSSCDNFYINTNVPSFSASSITDTVLNSVSLTKGGNNLIVKSTITNTDSGHVWLNVQSIKDGSYSNILCASPVAGVSCAYTSNIATYTFTAGALSSLSSGVKQAQFTATNISGINTGTTLASITLDNIAPTIGASTLLSPISGIFGGTGVTISWTPGNITDNIGLAYIQLDYFNGTIWTLIGTGANSGSHPWDITSLVSGANFQVRISAYDGVGLSSTFTGGVFALDKIAPSVPVNTLTFPNASGVKLKGGSNVNITWNSGNIIDTGGLATNPITLSYSLDGGTNYTQIATNLANNGSYAWTIPSALNNTTMKIQIEVVDNVGNRANTVSANNFEVDSTLPIITVSYAGLGGSTPQTNSYINNSGFDVSAAISDNNLSGGVIYYSLYDQTANAYFNGTTYTGTTEIWNTLGTSSGSVYNLTSTIVPGITNGDYYKLKLRADDIVGNSFSTPQITFIGDTISPTISATTTSGSYFSGAISITGTASDTGSTLSSVNLEIKKGAEWWNGSTWIASQQLLLATTANNYANWSYNFNPTTDIDGQAYAVIMTANDKAYKTNNISSGSLTLTKDTSGPTIPNGIFTNVITGIQKDGNVINITWNTGAITSTGAGINQNSIVLKFNNGAGIATIIGATANNGSYNYTLPTGNTQNAFFTIEAYDMVGNISNLVTSSGFALDSIPPTISTINTIEDTLGQINGVNIYFSELIPHSSIHLADFNIAGVVGIQTGTISDVGTGTIFAINFTSTGTTATTPTVHYIPGTLTDLALKPLADTTQVSIDKATPRFLSSKIYDTNGNGKVDQIIVSTSEPLVTNTDISSWIINSPFPGVSLSNASVIGNTVILNISEPTTANTSTGSMTLSFVNNGSWKDTANNLTSPVTNLPLTDTATPIITGAQTFDNAGKYAIDLTFSEPIIGTLSGFTLSGSSTYTGTILAININTLRLVTSDSTVTDTVKAYSLTYSGSGTYIKDVNNNYLANFSNRNCSDAIAPKILTRTTLDSNGNGKIDEIRFGFSEPLSGSSSGVSVSVAGYVVSSYNISGTGITAHLTEQFNPDTAVTPLVQIQNTTLTDISGNMIPSEGTATSATDTVGPVIVNIRFDGVNTLYATLSEAVSGTITPSSFILSGATATISSVNIPTGSSSGTLTLSNSGIVYGTSELSFTPNSVGDTLNNKQPNSLFTKISASVVINEVMWSGTGGSASQYIELRNPGAVPIDISNWTINNAATNGTGILTLPAAQTIPANGYYLITATNPGTVNNLLATGVVSNFAGVLSLTLGQTGNLILKTNGGIIYDQTKTNPWPAGDANLPASMERQNTPGDGLLASNWYIAQASSGFNIAGPLGTPKSANIFDATTPTITSSSPANNILSPIGNINISYNYSDSGGMSSTPIHTFLLEKNNGAGVFSDITATGITSSDITAASASFTTNSLSFGNYRATFTIQDTAGNTTQKIISFYVDSLVFTISTGSTNIGVLSTTSTLTAPPITVTIKTVGAGFNLSLGGSGTMNAGISQLAAWNGTKGFGFTSAAGGSGATNIATISSINPTTLENITFGTLNYIGGNGVQKTYTYTITYGAQIDSLQAAGVYGANTSYNLGLSY